MINLLSNAIRFSQTSEAKTIEITLEVSRAPPRTEDTCLRPLNAPEDLVPIAPGEKAPIYVYVSVHDSGPGLKPKDLELLVRSILKVYSIRLNIYDYSSNGSRRARYAIHLNE